MIFDLRMNAMPKKILGEKEISIPEAKKILENLENPNQFKVRTLDYAVKFSKIDSLKAKELVEKLVEKFEILRTDAVQIVNCMPKSIEELRVFFTASEKKIIVTSKLEEILKLLGEYR